jgi:three-Cys-motif partner protein
MDHYEGREQSAAKHLILGSYLEKLAYKIGIFRPGITLNYIDAFAGPWESQSSDLSDTSPAIALSKLSEAREMIKQRGRSIFLRAFFVSTTDDGVRQLESLREQFLDVEIVTARGTFLESLEAARKFSRGGSDPFSFIFIDHTGWTGFGLQQIAPLLREGANEVLINFMTGHISRFIDKRDPRYERTFDELFGEPSYRQQWERLQGLDREDTIVDTYCQRVQKVGNYDHGAAAVILNPLRNRTHFHLVYGTRSDKGLVTFREVERGAMEFQRSSRASVQQKIRIQRTHQEELLGIADPAHTYEDELRARYLAKAHRVLGEQVKLSGDVPWDGLVMSALKVPMICEADVKDWLAAQRKSGAVEVRG